MLSECVCVYMQLCESVCVRLSGAQQQSHHPEVLSR